LGNGCSEREIFFKGRSIDLIVTGTDQDRLQNTVFSHFRQVNAIELKGIHDPLTIKDYNRIMMRVWGLGGLKTELEENDEREESSDEGQLSPLPSQRTLTIICVTKPISLLKQVDEFQFLKTKEKGIYYYDGRIQQWIICPSELALIEKNYPLLPLSRGKKLEDFTSLCFRKGVQKTLIRQLRHKFAPIDDSVIQKIEATNDMDQLDIWLDQVIVADSLADTGLISEEMKNR